MAGVGNGKPPQTERIAGKLKGYIKIICSADNDYHSLEIVHLRAYTYFYACNMLIKNYLTIDVEDYFQVSAFEDCVDRNNWDNYPSRVEGNTLKILALLEEFNIKATFFILGWTAKKYPLLVRKIADGGHEVACHSHYHRLIYTLAPEEFRSDTKMAKEIIEQITGNQVFGYRAPSYSITKKSLWAVDILQEAGFIYSSSVFPVYHDLYGIPDAPRYPFLWDCKTIVPQMTEIVTTETDEVISTLLHDRFSDNTYANRSLLELPISTSLQFRKNIPIAGGGYFRLFPYWFTKGALRQINQKEQRPFIFYFHPWEIDPEQPRMKHARLRSCFRHYLNLRHTFGRLRKLLQDFSFHPICGAQNGKAKAITTLQYM